MKNFSIALLLSSVVTIAACDEGEVAHRFIITAGIGHDYVKKESQRYFKLTMDAKELFAKGNPIKDSKIEQATNLSPTAQDKGLLLSVSDGDFSLGGGLFEAYGLEPIERFIGRSSDFLVNFGVSSAMQGKDSPYSAKLGIEHKLLHPLSKLGVANWASIGVFGNSEKVEGGIQDDFASIGYRAFTAYGDGRYALQPDPETVPDEFLKMFPSYKEAKDATTIAENSFGLSKGELTAALVGFRAFVEGRGRRDYDAPDLWKEFAKRGLVSFLKAKSFYYPNLVYAEFAGRWCEGRKDPIRQTSHFWAAGYRFSAKPSGDGTEPFLEVRYENGFIPIDPKNRTTRFIATFGYKF